MDTYPTWLHACHISSVAPAQFTQFVLRITGTTQTVQCISGLSFECVLFYVPLEKSRWDNGIDDDDDDDDDDDEDNLYWYWL